MDGSGALSLRNEEVDVLRDCDRSLVEAGAWYESVRDAVRGEQDGGAFEESLRLKSVLDELEERVKTSPTLENLSVTLNAEYQLHKLNSQIPLRHNPFLSHWVEAIQRFENSAESRLHADEPLDKTNELNHTHIATARREIIETILLSKSLDTLAAQTPRALLDSSTRKYTKPHHFDVTPFITILEEEGIYEKRVSQPSPSDPSSSSTTTTTTIPPKHPTWKHRILSDLSTSPETAITALTHLPLDLQYLDFLNQLIESRTLEAHSIDPGPVLQNFIQHCLRQIEKMTDSPSSSTSPVITEPTNTNTATDTANNIFSTTDMEILDLGHGREAQSRAVKLLLLFMRNLVRKGLLSPQDVYFEIQEVCVRYVWIREVREFRGFVMGEGEG